MKPTTAIAFDLDGTLVDSAGGIAHALNTALVAAGLPCFDLQTVRSWIGEGPDALIARALAAHRLQPDVAQDLAAPLRRAFDTATLQSPMAGSTVFDGIARVLAALSLQHALVVVTNKPGALARAVLNEAGLLAFFAGVHGADEPAQRKPSPWMLQQAAAGLGVTPEALLMVGDAAGDIAAAQAAGCRAAWAGWGYGQRPEHAVDSVLHLNKPDDLLALLAAPGRHRDRTLKKEMTMPTGGKSTLTQFLIEERRRHPDATGDLNALITDVSLACKAIARRVAFGALADVLGADAHPAGAINVQGEEQKTLDVLSNALFVRATEWGGHLAGMVSEEMEAPYTLPAEHARGKYLLLFDPLDGSSNIDVNVSVGSIFSILRAATPGQDPQPQDYLQPGTAQVGAGYAIYGPSTMLVLTLGRGTHAFTLDPMLGEWVLSHPHLRIPESTREFAINASNSRFWEPAVKRYVDECMAGQTGPRDADFNMRWIASLVAETHRILMRGGVFLYPRDSKDPARAGRLRLLYEANPISFLVEQAGGRASTGRARLMDAQPDSLHQRIGFVFGSSQEVARIEGYHRDEPPEAYDAPLFGHRGLFAATA